MTTIVLKEKPVVHRGMPVLGTSFDVNRYAERNAAPLNAADAQTVRDIAISRGVSFQEAKGIFLDDNLSRPEKLAREVYRKKDEVERVRYSAEQQLAEVEGMLVEEIAVEARQRTLRYRDQGKVVQYAEVLDEVRREKGLPPRGAGVEKYRDVSEPILNPTAPETGFVTPEIERLAAEIYYENLQGGITLQRATCIELAREAWANGRRPTGVTPRASQLTRVGSYYDE